MNEDYYRYVLKIWNCHYGIFVNSVAGKGVRIELYGPPS